MQNACEPARCGDSITGPGEECDDGNENDDDGCTNECRRALFGDGIVQVGEECDDGNEEVAMDAMPHAVECRVPATETRLNRRRLDAAHFPLVGDFLFMSTRHTRSLPPAKRSLWRPGSIRWRMGVVARDTSSIVEITVGQDWHERRR